MVTKWDQEQKLLLDIHKKCGTSKIESFPGKESHVVIISFDGIAKRC